jgi:DNA-binding NarL/FixJ family response regulator
MIRVRIADNLVVVRLRLRALLEAHGNFEVCADASNGRDAVDLAIYYNPDAIILDLALPALDGIKTTRRIRTETKSTDVMVFTLRRQLDDIRAALRAGARGYILKSETEEQIVKAAEALGAHREFFSNTLPKSLPRIYVERPDDDSKRLLTTREQEVVCLIAEGKSNKMVAHLLNISTKTVEAHRSSAMRKLDVHSTANLVRCAIRFRLVDL